uniref:Cadherin domain-containing protein n=1 Tax=Parastrongyloides trichosuri TaxID=131310 RepID=A0A0N5A3B1_PARTI
MCIYFLLLLLLMAKTDIVVRMDSQRNIFVLPPRFEQAIYNFKIPENHSPGRIGIVKAHHRAEEILNDRTIYSILTLNEQSNYFVIDGNTGEINSTKSFDFEDEVTRFELKILGCLVSKPGLCGEADVLVSIVDMNDNSPIFNQEIYNLTVPMDLSAGSEIITLSAKDIDSGKNGQISYKLILNDTDKDIFSIDNITGTIYLEKEFEKRLVYQFEVEASDNGEPSLSSKAVINIVLGGSNPTAPEFDEFRYDINREAPIPAGVVLVQVHASDPDPGPEGIIKYQFGNASNVQMKKNLEKLSINEETGKISSIVELTANDGPIMQIIVEAIDQSSIFKRKSQTVVVIHIVSNQTDKLEFVPLPKIVYISSEKSLGSPIIRISAKSSLNELITFSLESDNRIKKYFMIEEDKLVLSRKLQPGEYILKMKASIRNDYLTASHQMKVVVMKDREKFPVFERLSYQFHIPINADFPLKLPKLNCTLANSPIEYSVFPSKDLPDGLNIDQVTGELTVNESFVLGYRKKGYVFVVVRARNMMSPQFFSDVGVTIKVDDTVFSSLLYRFTIDENTPVGSIINSSIKITNDENNDDRDIQYFVEPDDKFNIDKNGNLIVKKLIDLEKMKPESNGIINLNVIGKQNGETSSAKVQIKINDINEFPPQFVDEILKFTIDDENSKGDQLGTIAIRDEDFSGPGPLIFKFETQGQDVFVDIDNEGNVILKDNVNNIEIGEYELILTVKDKDGNEIEKLVTFERVSVDTVTEPILYEMEPIDWNVPDGSSFIGTKLLITMPLEENVTADWNFDILKGNEDNMFRVNRHNGSTAELEILTNDIHERLYLLDINGTNLANKLETMQLSVTVNFTNALQQFIPEFINEVPETVHISSDVNQTIPIFSATATVQADPNLPILYTVDSNSKEKIFSIDKDGNVYLVHVPNEEISRAYKVTVNAVSGTFKNEKVIAVIIDKFDTEETTINLLSTTEQNIISMTPSDTLITITPLPTNSERGEVVGKIDFNENDFNRENYKLKIDPEDYSLLFDADIDTGKVVMKRIPLSGWNRDDIKFNIKLIKINSENADIPTAHIEIQLQDVITTTNRIIIQPITSNIIASTTSNDMSQIDVTPSTVVMNSTLYTKESEYITTTQIGGIISLPDITNVTKRKIFETDVYYGEIKEGFYSTGVFVKLKPSNFKQEEFTKNNKVNYKIIYDNNNSSVLSSQFPIHVRRNNGDIIAIGDIDREKIDELKFFVEGTEVNNPTNKERVSVIIKILDVNDNKPIFENSTPIVLPVFSTTRPTEIIGTITAIDGDENESGKISYTLNDHGLNMFTIDKDNGNIILLKPLEYTNKTNFVDIIATDNGNPPLSTVYKLRIDTFPVNSDEEPLFNEGTYFYKIPYSHQLDIPFGQMVAGIGEYNYEIYPEDLFSIDKNNGKLYLSHSPTVEQCNTPQLVFVNATSKLSEIKASTTFEVTFDSCSSMKPNLQSTTGSPTSGQTECVFNSKVYSTEIVENAIGINKLLTLTSTCGDDAVYSIFQGEDKFVIDKNTGEFFVAKPLDYEIKTTHYVIVQVNYKYSEQVRDKRQPSTNKIIDDYVKNRLTQSQALIVIHVLNVNDNPPKFQNINKDMSKYIFYLNWKTKESEVVGNVRAFDADINDKIEYYLLRDEFDDYDYFHIDKDTGKIRLYKNVFYSDKSVFNVKIMATDSMNNVTTDALFYKIAPGVNIVSIGLNDTGNINENEIVRKLGTIVDKDIRLVNKQSVSGINSEDEQMNKTQLLVYGIDKKTNEPIKDDVLKTDFIGKLRQIHTSGIKVNSVSTLNNISHFGLSKLEYLLIILCVLLLLFTCCIFCLICYFCKRNKNISKNEKDYMIDVINAGPRPYNVELISRKNAQEILQSKDIPEPKEDVTDALEALYGKIDRTRKSNNNQKKNTNILDLKTDQTEYTHDRGISYDIEDPTQMIEASIINRAYSPNENEIEKGKPSLKKKIII